MPNAYGRKERQAHQNQETEAKRRGGHASDPAIKLGQRTEGCVGAARVSVNAATEGRVDERNAAPSSREIAKYEAPATRSQKPHKIRPPVDIQLAFDRCDCQSNIGNRQTIDHVTRTASLNAPAGRKSPGSAAIPKRSVPQAHQPALLCPAPADFSMATPTASGSISMRKRCAGDMRLYKASVRYCRCTSCWGRSRRV